MALPERDARTYFQEYDTLKENIGYVEPSEAEVVHMLITQELYREYVLIPQKETEVLQILQPCYPDHIKVANEWAKEIASNTTASSEIAEAFYEENKRVLQEEKIREERARREETEKAFQERYPTISIPAQDIATTPTEAPIDALLENIFAGDFLASLDLDRNSPKEKAYVDKLLRRSYYYLDHDIQVPQVLSSYGEKHFLTSDRTYRIKPVNISTNRDLFSGWKLESLEKQPEDDLYRVLGALYVGLEGYKSQIKNFVPACMGECGVAYVAGSSIYSKIDVAHIIRFSQFLEEIGLTVSPSKHSYRTKLRNKRFHMTPKAVTDHIRSVIEQKVARGFEKSLYLKTSQQIDNYKQLSVEVHEC